MIAVNKNKKNVYPGEKVKKVKIKKINTIAKKKSKANEKKYN